MGSVDRQFYETLSGVFLIGLAFADDRPLDDGNGNTAGDSVAVSGVPIAPMRMPARQRQRNQPPVAAVGRTTISLTSTSAGWAIA